ncbi:MAG: hypothetical protein Q9222_006699 [Ikaeria aurantiellina]
MNVGKAPACVPTWRGHVETTKDALLIFEACFQGALAHCFRRPHDRERGELIKSGNVFVYEEATSGIKRWTDGIPWSPSRILTNFLIYRQLNNPFPPGEKKRATKRNQRAHKAAEPYPSSATSTTVKEEYSSSFSPESPGVRSDEGVDRDGDRGLVGSLVDSYEFKEKGLLKKTMTVTIKGVQHHLVSYYSLDDAKHKLQTPKEDKLLKDLALRPELLQQPKFKFQNLDDAGDGTYEQSDQPYVNWPFAPNGVDPARSYSMPTHAHGTFSDPASPFYYPNHPPYLSSGHAPNGIAYGAMPASSAVYAPAVPTSGYSSNQAYMMNTQYSPQGPPNHHQAHAQQQSQHHLHQPQHHMTSPHTQQMQPPHLPQFSPASTLPRPNGFFDGGSVAQQTNGLQHSSYESFSATATHITPPMIYPGMAQVPNGYMNSTQSYTARSDGTSQSYRAY